MEKLMNLQTLQLCWHQLGQTAPMEHIFAPPRMRGKNWDPEAFFASGRQEVERVSRHFHTLGLSFSGGQALDFGCGLGRVTQALVPSFEVVHGIDIAPSMLEQAQKYNQYGDQCRYHLNQREDLQRFADNSFDAVYSIITLQNMEPHYARDYIIEFTRILAPGGLLLFQLPSRPLTLRHTLKELIPEPFRDWLYRLKYRDRPRLEIHGIRRKKVIELLESHRIKILDIQPDRGAYRKWSSYRYYGIKV
jgi:ubiquinone/menaquinone biosynthesis C-methylase UbiE